MSTQTTTAKDSSNQQNEEQIIVLLADSFSETGIETLKAMGCHVISDPSLKDDMLVEAITSCNPSIVIVRSTKVTEEMMRAAPSLGVIIRAGAGYDTIDVRAASSLGIFVANCPGKNSIAVAELAWSLILSCDRRVPDQVRDLRDGKWRKKEYAKASGLCGRTIGIVGLGGIGIETAKRALAFGMNVVAWSRSLTEEKASDLGIGWCESLNNLARMSDVVSVHVAATPETEKLIDESFLNSMKHGATFVNTSRGKVVDEVALQQAVENKNLRVGLDVFVDEPTTGDAEFSPAIISCDGVYGTHHVGASTKQAQEAIADEAIRIVQYYISDGVVQNCVNRAASTSAKAMLCVRHRNKPGVLAHVFEVLSQDSVNVEEMENVIYQGEEAACARIQLSASLSEDSMQAILQNPHVLSATTSTISE
ncbi:MAG: NAD(P)-dependent oxidoreductase [Phycisphaerales bacterium]|jgi:D-3-phosphoglycerate dehydrogenase|nr:NAD(P)-dependent oxidoreductase [Phycisphaerales bacterium]